MKYKIKYLILFLLLIVLPINVFSVAEFTQITNGSFEAGQDFNDSIIEGVSAITGWEMWVQCTPAGNLGLTTNPSDVNNGVYSVLHDNLKTTGCFVLRPTDKFYSGEKIKLNYKLNASAGHTVTFRVDANSGANLFTDSIASGSGVWSEATFTIPNTAEWADGNILTIYGQSDIVTSSSDYFIIDNVKVKRKPRIVLNLNFDEVNEVGNSFNIDATATFDNNGSKIDTATCNMTFDGITTSMSLISDGVYRFSTTQYDPRLYSFNVGCTGEEMIDANITDSVNVTVSLIPYLDITPIGNVYENIKIDKVELGVPNDDNTLIFKAESSYSGSLDINYLIFNDLKDNCKQYFIYTATQGDYSNNKWFFNETLTFGSSDFADNPIQKTWNPNNDEYEYSFMDVLTSGEIKYYKIEYNSVPLCWDSVNSADWDNQLMPESFDFNGAEILQDRFTTSAYANIQSTMIKHPLAEINSSSFSTRFTGFYAFQFNARGEETGNQLKVGYVADGAETMQTTTLLPANKTYSANGIKNDFLRFKTENATPANYVLSEYRIVPRAYFMQPMELLNSDGDPLPLHISGNILPDSVIKEGANFKARIYVHDPSNDLNSAEIRVYLDAIADNNLIRSFRQDFTSTDPNEMIEFDIEGIVDITANAPDRDLFVVARIEDNNGSWFETQSKPAKLHQVPKTIDDLDFSFTQINFKVGEAPEGYIALETPFPEIIRAVQFQLFTDTNTLPDVNKVYYKDQDFTCSNFDCSFNYKFDDYIFSKDGNYRMVGTVWTTTESPNFSNQLLSKRKVFRVFYKGFQVAKILQTRERADRKYKDSEIMSFVLVLQDDDRTNMRNDINTFMKVRSCNQDASGACNGLLSDRFDPTGFIYDATSGTNFFFFRHYFIDGDNTPLDDGNYYRVYAEVHDTTKERQGSAEIIVPLLSDKCATTDTDNNFASAILSLIYFGYGCTAQTPDLVTLTDNSASEKRILIDNAITPDAPTQELFWCVNADQNNVFTNTLQQDIICGVWYTIGSQEIDSFKLTIGNDYSDYSESDPAFQQFFSVKIPYELIAINDPVLMKKQLETNYNTSIDTIGDFLWFGINELGAPILNYTAGITKETMLDNNQGITANIGYDYNFNKAFSPTNLSGFFFYKIKGLKVVNKKDYETTPEIEAINPKRFYEEMHYLNTPLPENETTVQIYVTNFNVPLNKTVPSRFVIDEEPSIAIQQQNADLNTTFETSTTTLNFTFANDLKYDWERESIRRFLPMRFKQRIVQDSTQAFLEGLNELQEDPIAWAWKNWFGIFIIFVVVLGISFIVALWRVKR